MLLQNLHNTAYGRIYIVGNGPSLLTQNLDWLEGEQTFTCNRFSDWEGAFVPTYHICSKAMVDKGYEPSDPPFQRYKFIAGYGDGAMDGWVYVRKGRNRPLGGLGETIDHVRTKASQVFVMTQVALWLGYRDIRLMGVEQKGDGHVFDPEGTFVPFIPAPKGQVVYEWAKLREYAEADGATIADLTPDGMLATILPTESYENIYAR